LGVEWAVLGLAAALIALLALPTAVRTLAGLALAGLIALIAMEGLRSLRCPECLARRLVLVRGAVFGERFARCESCGRRWSRRLLSTWEPADGDEHDAVFRRVRPTDPWGGGPVVDETAPTDGTHGRLLRVKRDAHDNPRRPPPVT
jgi:hypothetical protein